MIKKEQLQKINSCKNQKSVVYYVDALNIVLPDYQINTPLRLAHFLAQVIHESGHLSFKEENLNYTTEGLLTVFKKYFDNRDLADKYARKPQAVANKVYANRMGNGDEKSGDGWKYRGRGLIQLTGKNNYKECAEYLQIDIVNNPELVIESPVISVKCACWYWQKCKLNGWADKDDIVTITKLINGGLNGIEDRKKILEKARSLIGGVK